MRSLGSVLASGVLLAILGCASGDKPAPVTGSVKYKGKPLEQGTILFYPEVGRPASGQIVAGEIVDVTTYNIDDGVLPGKCRVAIQAVENAGDMYKKQRSLIPDNYATPEKSGLTAEVSGGSDSPLVFELK
jgi:hypothetical protein